MCVHVKTRGWEYRTRAWQTLANQRTSRNEVVKRISTALAHRLVSEP